MRYRDYLIKTSESSWPRALDRVTPYTILGGGIWNAIRANKRSKKEGRTGLKRALDVLKGGAKGSLYGLVAGQAVDMPMVLWRINRGLLSDTTMAVRPYDIGWGPTDFLLDKFISDGKYSEWI